MRENSNSKSYFFLKKTIKGVIKITELEKLKDVNKELPKYIKYLKEKYNIDERRAIINGMQDEKKKAAATILLL